MRNKKIKVADWGSLSYGEAWERQEEYFAQVIAQKKENRKLSEPLPTDNYFFLVEHPPSHHVNFTFKDNESILFDGKKGERVYMDSSFRLKNSFIL